MIILYALSLKHLTGYAADHLEFRFAQFNNMVNINISIELFFILPKS